MRYPVRLLRGWSGGLLVSLLSGTLLMTATANADEAARSPAAILVASSRPLVIAHRGASADAPENTVAAFRLALQARPDLVELDYYHSSDGRLVVFHDKELDRTTNAVTLWGGKKVPIGSKTLAELKQLDAGSWFGPQFAGEPIPTLDESLDVIQAGSVTLIERKAGDAATVVDLLRRRGLLEQVVVQSFDWKYIAECRRLAPELQLGAISGKDFTPAAAAEAAQLGANVLVWNHEKIDAAAVAAVHQHGLRLWTYTVNDAARMRRLLEMGVDGIISDRPALAAATLRADNKGE